MVNIKIHKFMTILKQERQLGILLQLKSVPSIENIGKCVCGVNVKVSNLNTLNNINVVEWQSELQQELVYRTGQI